MRLGLSKSEFFAMVPRLFIELRKQWREGQREKLTMLAALRKDIINFSFNRPKEPVTMEDLLPSEHHDPPKRKRMTARRREQVADRIRARMARMPNLVVVKEDRDGRIHGEDHRIEGAG
jgi:hypothetical protein